MPQVLVVDGAAILPPQAFARTLLGFACSLKEAWVMLLDGNLDMWASSMVVGDGELQPIGKLGAGANVADQIDRVVSISSNTVDRKSFVLMAFEPWQRDSPARRIGVHHGTQSVMLEMA